MVTLERHYHDCVKRPIGIELYKDGEYGLWYIKDHFNGFKQFHIYFCPFCGSWLRRND